MIYPKRSFEGKKVKLVVYVLLFLINLLNPSYFSSCLKNVSSFLTKLNSTMLLLHMCKLVSNAMTATLYMKITKCASVNDAPSCKLEWMICF